MTPDRTGPGFAFRTDLRTPIGRVRISLGTKKLAVFRRREAVVKKLIENDQLKVLQALVDGDVAIEEIVEADREGGLKGAGVLANLRLRQPLWHQDAHCPRRANADAPHTDACLGAVDRTLPRMGRGAETRRRYETSLKKLASLGLPQLGRKARVADLARVDWKALYQRWREWEEEHEGGYSGSDWNHLRRAISHFLTQLLGHKHHAFRLELMTPDMFPIAPEREVTPDVSIDEFLDLVSRTPAHARPCYWTLVLTGMRLREYLLASKESIDATAHAVDVPLAKTKSGRVYVAGDLWPWIEAGIPSPLKAKWMRIHFKRAARAVGKPELRLHDLRHLLGQWADDAGATIPQIQQVLRHATPAMTMRYARRRAKGEVARLVGEAITQRRGA